MKIRNVIATDNGRPRGSLVGVPVTDDTLAERLITAWAEARGWTDVRLRMPHPGVPTGDIVYLPGPYVTSKLHEVYEQARIASANDDVRMH